MPVTESCSPNGQGVELDLSQHQKLRYTIDIEGSVVYSLRGGVTLLPKSGESEETCLWPEKPEDVTGTEARHGLAMQFGGAGKLRWQIEQLAADDTVIEVIRDCNYTNEGAPEDHMAAFRIFLVL